MVRPIVFSLVALTCGAGLASCRARSDGEAAPGSAAGAAGGGSGGSGGTLQAGAPGAGGMPSAGAGFTSAGQAGAASVTACVPGQVGPCSSCATLGARRCAADGSAWGACECTSYGVELSVAPSGDDAAAGSLDSPFATLERARDAVRELVLNGIPEGGVAVWLRGGVYERSESLVLTAEDSGAPDRPVAWRAYPGEEVRWMGGQRLELSAASLVDESSPGWARLDATARGNVVAFDLAALGINDYGALVRRGFCAWGQHSGLELFADGQALPLARWPDAGANDIAKSPETADRVELFGSTTPDVTGSYTRQGEQDGVSWFARDGLVAGIQYYLYRRTWDYEGQTHTAWFISAEQGLGYPSDTHPWWHHYAAELGAFEAGTGATGTPTTRDPQAVNHGFTSVASAASDTIFGYLGDRPARWTGAPDAWVHGFWRYAWADCHEPISAIDTTARTITLPESPGYGIQAAQPWYAYNLLEELTSPGEWYLDRATGRLYLWPPAGSPPAELVVSLMEAPLLDVNGASYLEVHDVIFEAGRNDLVRIAGDHVVLSGVTLRNGGANAATVAGTSSGVRACQVYGTAAGGVRVSGGDRPSLTAAGNFVESCDIHDFGRMEWTYRPGVSLDGVGNVAKNNLIHDAPHSAILFGGNEHTLELNEIHNVCRFSSDAGAIYSGRDWGARGNVIRHNFIHDISTFFEGYGVHGVYLDDCLSGIRVEGNVLYRISGHGIQHGGGRDDIMVNNVIARSGDALAADSRGYEWRPDAGPNNTPGDSWNLLEKLQAVGYQDEPWASRYPECAAIPSSWDVVIAPDATWLFPEGSVFSRNVGFSNGRFIQASATTLQHYAEQADNLEDQDPLFVDEASLDLTLRPESPALALPGFEPIPFSSIGIRP